MLRRVRKSSEGLRICEAWKRAESVPELEVGKL